MVKVRADFSDVVGTDSSISHHEIEVIGFPAGGHRNLLTWKCLPFVVSKWTDRRLSMTLSGIKKRQDSCYIGGLQHERLYQKLQYAQRRGGYGPFYGMQYSE